MNQQVSQDEPVSSTADQTPPTEARTPAPRFPEPLWVVLLVAFCGLAGPVCFRGLAILR